MTADLLGVHIPVAGEVGPQLIQRRNQASDRGCFNQKIVNGECHVHILPASTDR